MTGFPLQAAVPFRDGRLAGILRDADRAVTLAINDFDSMFTDALMPWLSNRLVWIPFYLVLLWFLWRELGLKKTALIVVAVVLSVVAIDQFANLVKYAVHRYRPCWDTFMIDNGLKVLEGKGSKFGFFSAHAATTAGVATSVMYFVRRHWGVKGRRYRLLAALFATWVIAVSISRVYVGKHFVGDIVTGAVVGMVFARFISWLLRKFYDKFFVNL